MSKGTAKVHAKLQEAAKREGVVTHEDDPIITYAEAGRQLGKPRETVRRWANDGLLTIHRHPSGLPGVRGSEILQLLKAARGGK
jgi:hypothetical protein